MEVHWLDDPIMTLSAEVLLVTRGAVVWIVLCDLLVRAAKIHVVCCTPHCAAWDQFSAAGKLRLDYPASSAEVTGLAGAGRLSTVMAIEADLHGWQLVACCESDALCDEVPVTGLATRAAREMGFVAEFEVRRRNPNSLDLGVGLKTLMTSRARRWSRPRLTDLVHILPIDVVTHRAGLLVGNVVIESGCRLIDVLMTVVAIGIDLAHVLHMGKAQWNLLDWNDHRRDLGVLAKGKRPQRNDEA